MSNRNHARQGVRNAIVWQSVMLYNQTVDFAIAEGSLKVAVLTVHSQNSNI